VIGCSNQQVTKISITIQNCSRYRNIIKCLEPLTARYYSTISTKVTHFRIACVHVCIHVYDYRSHLLGSHLNYVYPFAHHSIVQSVKLKQVCPIPGCWKTCLSFWKIIYSVSYPCPLQAKTIHCHVSSDGGTKKQYSVTPMILAVQ